MKTTYALLLSVCLFAPGCATAGQMQLYPQYGSIAAQDLIPFSQYNGGNWNSPLNITGVNFALSMQSLGGYPTLTANQTWTGNSIWQGADLHTGQETFNGFVTVTSTGGPPGTLLFVNASYQLQKVTLGANIFLDSMGNLTIATNVSTNSIAIPVPVAQGGTGETNGPLAVANLGAAFANGSTVFPGLLDSGPSSNSLLVIEATSAGPTVTNIPAPPGNGYYLGATNTTPGVAWFQFPVPPSSGTTGSIGTHGYTNNTGFPVDILLAAASTDLTIKDNSGTGWQTVNFANVGSPLFLYLPTHGAIASVTGGLIGSYHVHEQ